MVHACDNRKWDRKPPPDVGEYAAFDAIKTALTRQRALRCDMRWVRSRRDEFCSRFLRNGKWSNEYAQRRHRELDKELSDLQSQYDKLNPLQTSTSSDGWE